MSDGKHVMIENAKLIFRNFAGREQQFNAEGDRNFNVVLGPKLAEKLKAEGWNVRQLRPVDEETPGDYVIQVTVNYKKGRPPRVVMITSQNRVELGSDEVGLLDVADIKQADIMLNGYEWSVSGNSGIKAYLKSAFITIDEDELEQKYALVGADVDN